MRVRSYPSQTSRPAERGQASRWWPAMLGMLLLAGCSTTPATGPGQTLAGGPICDSYIVFDMCVRDLVGDGSVDMIYFQDSNKVFMYRQGMRDSVSQVMPMHRCAVSLDAELQAATNRILDRSALSMSEQLGIKRVLLVKYLAAKPEIDQCNARFAREMAQDTTQEEFFMGDSGWEDEAGALSLVEDSGKH